MNAPEKAFGIQSYYELIHEGSNSNHEKMEVIVVSSQEQMEGLYAQINSTRKPGLTIPEVDFKEEVLIFAYAGQKPTGGYHIAITEVEDKKVEKRFLFDLKSPQGKMVTMSVTSSFKIIKVTHEDKKITATF
ncbi:protease complex subunit PrcB family protein [Nonlabens sp.]|uniref:protease complex subunit PrcB family protein n=1 Tax=Nonlabens sp. TaxID=1888209 RepID=UPI003F696C66